MDKAARRRSCFDRIQSLNAAEKRAFSQAICERIEASPAFCSAKTVFAYAALPGEPDLQTLIENHREKRWAFPRIGVDDRLDFFQVSSPTEMIPGRLGIAEPDPANRIPEDPSAADLILVPARELGLRSDRLEQAADKQGDTSGGDH